MKQRIISQIERMRNFVRRLDEAWRAYAELNQRYRYARFD